MSQRRRSSGSTLSPLFEAIRKYDVDLVYEALKGGNPDEICKGYSALEYAVKKFEIEQEKGEHTQFESKIIAALISEGAEIDDVEIDGLPLAFWAAKNDAVEVIFALQQRGHDLTEPVLVAGEEQTPGEFAIRNNALYAAQLCKDLGDERLQNLRVTGGNKPGDTELTFNRKWPIKRSHDKEEFIRKAFLIQFGPISRLGDTEKHTASDMFLSHAYAGNEEGHTEKVVGILEEVTKYPRGALLMNLISVYMVDDKHARIMFYDRENLAPHLEHRLMGYATGEEISVSTYDEDRVISSVIVHEAGHQARKRASGTAKPYRESERVKALKYKEATKKTFLIICRAIGLQVDNSIFEENEWQKSLVEKIKHQVQESVDRLPPDQLKTIKSFILAYADSYSADQAHTETVVRYTQALVATQNDPGALALLEPINEYIMEYELPEFVHAMETHVNRDRVILEYPKGSLEEFATYPHSSILVRHILGSSFKPSLVESWATARAVVEKINIAPERVSADQLSTLYTLSTHKKTSGHLAKMNIDTALGELARMKLRTKVVSFIENGKAGERKPMVEWLYKQGVVSKEKEQLLRVVDLNERAVKAKSWEEFHKISNSVTTPLAIFADTKKRMTLLRERAKNKLYDQLKNAIHDAQPLKKTKEILGKFTEIPEIIMRDVILGMADYLDKNPHTVRAEHFDSFLAVLEHPSGKQFAGDLKKTFDASLTHNIRDAAERVLTSAIETITAETSGKERGVIKSKIFKYAEAGFISVDQKDKLMDVYAEQKKVVQKSKKVAKKTELLTKIADNDSQYVFDFSKGCKKVTSEVRNAIRANIKVQLATGKKDNIMHALSMLTNLADKEGGATILDKKLKKTLRNQQAIPKELIDPIVNYLSAKKVRKSVSNRQRPVEIPVAGRKIRLPRQTGA